MKNDIDLRRAPFQDALDETVENLRSRLPLLSRGVALNHAGIAPQPLSNSISLFEQSRAEVLSPEALSRVGKLRSRVRSLCAEMLSVDSTEIALTKNTAEGVNFIAQGFPWKEGDRILTVGVEYPSNVYPWWNIRDRGVKIDAIPEVNGRVSSAALESAIGPRTRMLALSHVEFASGFAFDIDRLSEICRERELFLFLDIAQSIGSLPVNLARVDAAAWPTWKWLMGPIGMGGFYLSKRHLETIRPTYVGADGMVSREDYLDYNFEFRGDCSRFEYSTENMLGIIGMAESLEIFAPLFRDGGLAIRDRILKNCDEVIDVLGPLGYRLFSSRENGERSGILSFITPEDPARAHAKLRAAGIDAAVRAGRLRISPHFYNTSNDFDRLAEALRAS